MIHHLCLCIVSSVIFCAGLPSRAANRFVTPTERVDAKNWPSLVDDLAFENMDVAIQRQLQRYAQIGLNGSIRLGPDTYPLQRAKKSLLRFQELVEQYRLCEKSKNRDCQAGFERQLKLEFVMYRPLLQKGDPRFGEKNPVLFTGYYTPQLRVSLKPTVKFRYPVYKRPGDEKSRALPRREIDFRNGLKNKNLELFYTDDLFDLYLLHVQGGGRVLYEDAVKASPKYLSYDGANGLAWTFISTYMKKRGMIPDVSVVAQREYLSRHPEDHEEIYATCPSYVYFKTTNEAPVGSDSVSLTDNRSIATDTAFYKFKGLLAFVTAERPEDNQALNTPSPNVDFKRFSRFYLDQDTGGAIKGRGRVDLYFGEGDYAELAAYNLVKRGDLYFLMLKNGL